MSATYIQSAEHGNAGVSGGSGATVAFGSPNTAHSTILVFVTTDNNAAPHTPTFIVTDSNNGAVYIQVGSYVRVDDGFGDKTSFAVLMAADVLAGANSVTALTDQSALGFNVMIAEYSGNAGIPPLIGSNSPGGAGTSSPSVTLTTTAANQMAAIFFHQAGWDGTNGTVTGPSGFTRRIGFNPTVGGVGTQLWDKTIAAPSTASYGFTQTGVQIDWAFGVVITDAPIFTFVPQVGAFFCGI